MKRVFLLTILVLMSLSSAIAQVGHNVNDLRSETVRNPQNGEAWYRYANASYIEGDYLEAIGALTKAETFLPKHDKTNRAQVLRVRSLIMMQQKYVDYAMDNINAAIKLDSKNPELYYVRGVFFLTQGDIKGAERDKKRISRKVPTSPYVFMLGGRIAMDQGNNDAAIQLFENAIQSSSGLDDYQKASVYSLRGTIYHSQFLYQLAALDFVSALKIRYNQNDYDMLMNVADKDSGVCSVVDSACLQFPNNPMWYKCKGTIYFRQKKYCPQAIDAFQTAAALVDNVETEIDIADCYMRTGHKTCALVVINAALKKFNNHIALQDMKNEIMATKDVALPSAECGCEEEQVNQRSATAGTVTTDDPETRFAIESARVLIELLKTTQNNPDRLRTPSFHDPLVDKCLLAVEDMPFYQKHCGNKWVGLDSGNEAVRETTQLFKEVLEFIETAIYEEIRPIDFSDIISNSRP